MNDLNRKLTPDEKAAILKSFESSLRQVAEPDPIQVAIDAEVADILKKSYRQVFDECLDEFIDTGDFFDESDLVLLKRGYAKSALSFIIGAQRHILNG